MFEISVNTELGLHVFDAISLSQMEDIRLMKRIDRKYVFPVRLLPQILRRLPDDYYIQEVDGRRSAKYATLYYDTPDYEMFRLHQNGKLNRLKVRIREYVDSDLRFLEIKEKSNKGVTHKMRVSAACRDSINETESTWFLTSNTPYCPSALEAKLWSFYKRITLVNKNKTERLTIDFNLKFRNDNNGRKISLPDLAVIEIKKEQNSDSPVTSGLKRMKIKPQGMSKYCLGVALTENRAHVKTNAFKAKIISINKITSFQYG